MSGVIDSAEHAVGATARDLDPTAEILESLRPPTSERDDDPGLTF